MTLVPPLVTMLAMSPQVSRAQLAGTRVISSGGSPISASVLDKLREKTRPDCDIKVRQSANMEGGELLLTGWIWDDRVSNHMQDDEITPR